MGKKIELTDELYREILKFQADRQTTDLAAANAFHVPPIVYVRRKEKEAAEAAERQKAFEERERETAGLAAGG